MAGTNISNMPFGVAPVGDMFHMKIDELFSGMPNVFSIDDDILIAGFESKARTTMQH